MIQSAEQAGWAAVHSEQQERLPANLTAAHQPAQLAGAQGKRQRARYALSSRALSQPS